MRLRIIVIQLEKVDAKWAPHRSLIVYALARIGVQVGAVRQPFSSFMFHSGLKYLRPEIWWMKRVVRFLRWQTRLVTLLSKPGFLSPELQLHRNSPPTGSLEI